MSCIPQQTLVARGANIEAREKDDCTSLFLACMEGRSAVVQVDFPLLHLY